MTGSEDRPMPQGLPTVGDFEEMMKQRGIPVQSTGASGASGGSTLFNVPIGPPQTVGTDTFLNPDAPYISKWDGIRTETPTMTNQQIAQDLAMKHARDPEAQVAFEEALSRSGYGSLDEVLYAASLAQEPWEEFLYQRASSGLFGGGGGSGGPTTTVTTNISNRGQAYNTINPSFERGLGRQIDEEGLGEFKETLNAFEEENPYVTNSGRGFSKTTGGFDPSEMVRSYVEGQDDYAESQVAMNFLGVLDNILKDPSNRPGADLQERMAGAGY
jgi:hypothetical protein